MKRILTRAAALALACALMLPLAACGGGTEEPADNTPRRQHPRGRGHPHAHPHAGARPL